MVLEVLKPGWVGEEDHSIFSIDIHPSGSKFATGGQGNDCGKIVIWNLLPLLDLKAEKDDKIPKQLCQMENHLACVNCVRWSHSGSYLASAGDDKLVMIWTKSQYGGGALFGGGGKVNIESYKCLQTLRYHNGDVLDVSWGPGDSRLATCSVDNTIVVWDVDMDSKNSFRPQAVLRGHSGHVKGVTWDPVGKYLASQSTDKTLRIWRTTDWNEESCVSDPFQDCGGTTHVLRLSWSPDGQYIVSAHAMNGGGPTAQIVEREGFKTEKDFVGHRKAVTCVRFSNNIMEKKDKSGKSNQFLCLALGSRDRSVSVWLTCRQRPFFVCHDLFESSVMDLAWSKDGMVLLACSYDGQVAAFIFTPEDLGTPISTGARDDMFQKLYGQTAGATISNKPVLIENASLYRFANGSTNGKPEVAFEWDKVEGAVDNDSANSTFANSQNNHKNGIQIKGPLDKQIEVRTSDGRRRITPMFIPPTMDNSVSGDFSRNSLTSESFSKQLNSSSSSDTKSRIRIEGVEGVVEPNVSPGKKSQQPTSNGSASNQNSVSNGVENKDQPGSKPAGPPVNMIQVKRKVGTAIVPVTSAPASTSTSSTTSSSTPSKQNEKPSANTVSSQKAAKDGKVSTSKEGDKKAKSSADGKASSKDDDDEDVIKGTGNKSVNRIESSDSDGDEDSDSDSDDSSTESDSDSDSSTAASQTDKSDADKKGKMNGHDKKASKVKPKVSVIGVKRKLNTTPGGGQDTDDQQASGGTTPVRKRGRPAGTGHRQLANMESAAASTTATAATNNSTTATASSAVVPVVQTNTTPAVAPKVQPIAQGGHQPSTHLVPVSPARSTPGLPPLNIPRNPHYVLIKLKGRNLHVHIKNEFEKSGPVSLHRLSVHKEQQADSPLLWDNLFSSPISGVFCGDDLIIVTCRDASLHCFQAAGSRALPPLTLPTPAHLVKVQHNRLTVVTTGGRMYVWRLSDGLPKVIFKNEEIAPLNRHTSPRTSISVTSISFSKDQPDCPVLSLSDGSAHTLSQDLGCWLQLSPSRFSLSLAASNSEPPACMPLAAITAKSAGPSLTKLSRDVCRLFTNSVIENKLAACVYLNSPQEYRYWLLILVKQLAAGGQETRLRSILDQLLTTAQSQDVLSSTSSSSSGAVLAKLGLDSVALAEEALAQVASNLALQRLFTEYRFLLDMRKNKSTNLFQ